MQQSTSKGKDTNAFRTSSRLIPASVHACVGCFLSKLILDKPLLCYATTQGNHNADAEFNVGTGRHGLRGTAGRAACRRGRTRSVLGWQCPASQVLDHVTSGTQRPHAVHREWSVNLHSELQNLFSVDRAPLHIAVADCSRRSLDWIARWIFILITPATTILLLLAHIHIV